MKMTIKTAIFLAAAIVACDVVACTSAIVSGTKTLNGRPLLWKHRDTGEENNKVERIKATDKSYEYVALYNASDSLCKEAWMGYNSEGFAIMNTASYNLKDDDVKNMDKEGVVMTEALKKCRTVDDFGRLLEDMPKPLGVEANFGVIDAAGNGAYFETNNTRYTRYNLSDAPDGVLIRTNYSYSGRKDKGMGYIRENNERYLFPKHILAADFTPAFFTEEVSRTFYNSLLEKDYTNSGDSWIVDQDFIPRRSSTATTVIEGVKVGENPALTVMWIGIGYPPCSEVRAVWLGDNGVPEELRGIGDKGHSPLCDKVVERKHEVFSIKRGNGKNYLNLRLLYNPQGTGYCQMLIPANLKTYKAGYAERDRRAALLDMKKKGKKQLKNNKK